MINTTIFKSAFILLVMVSSAISHPVETKVADPQSSKPTTQSTPVIPGDHYDQRQNGTKNFRIHVDGVVLVVAPAEALLLAGELDPSLLGFPEAGHGDSSKPESPAYPHAEKPSVIEEVQKPMKQKSAHSHGFRLSNLLGPLLRRISP